MIKKILILTLSFLFLTTPVFANSIDYSHSESETFLSQSQQRDREYKPYGEETVTYEDCGPETDCAEGLATAGLFSVFTVTGIMGLWFVFIMAAVAINIAGIVLNVYFLIDCANREFEDKNLWIVLLVVGLFTGLNFIVSLLYYFIVKRKLDGK